MKKLSFISFVLVLAMVLTVLFPMNILAAKDTKTVTYTALGDSIAAGYGVPEETRYINLLKDSLESKYDSVQFNPLAVSGMTSSGLLNLLDSNGEAIKGSDIITVCIGANNLLPVLAQILVQQATKALSSLTLEQLLTIFTPDQLALLGITTDELYQLKMNQMSPEQVQALIVGLKANLASLTLQGILSLKLNAVQMSAVGLTPSQLLLSLTSDQISLLNMGVMQFKSDWPEIMNKIDLLAPSAKVYVMTVYNPLSSSDPAYGIIDGFINEINTEIIDNAEAYSYKVADVHTAFAEKDASILTGFYTTLDPHPTVLGQEAIYEAHLGVIKPNLDK